jgi:hypothetical protein
MVSQKMCKEMLGNDLPWDDKAMVCAGGRSTDACQVSLPATGPGLDYGYLMPLAIYFVLARQKYKAKFHSIFHFLVLFPSF